MSTTAPRDHDAAELRALGISPTRSRVYLAIGSALYLGLAPVAPGTFGALVGVAVHVIAVMTLPPTIAWAVIFAALIAVSVANHVLTPWAERYFHSDDPKNFVLDEVAGYLVVPLLFPHGPLVPVAVSGFLLFRIFDIIKIPPARQIDRDLHGPWGILLDDIVSGAYAALALYAARAVDPGLGVHHLRALGLGGLAAL